MSSRCRSSDRTLISEVVIARMLMPFSASVLNMVCATPAWLRMPMPMTDTNVVKVSVIRSDLDLGGGDREDVDALLGQRLEHGLRDARMAAHADADDRHECRQGVGHQIGP